MLKLYTVKKRFEREVPLSQAAMVDFVAKLRKKSIKVIWFSAGKLDVTKMLKECKMWAEKIPQEIANSDTELGKYFRGAGMKSFFASKVNQKRAFKNFYNSS